jgi:hypothetical protein
VGDLLPGAPAGAETPTNCPGHIDVPASNTAALLAQPGGLGFGFEHLQIDTQPTTPIEVSSGDHHGEVSQSLAPCCLSSSCVRWCGHRVPR